MGVGNPVRGVEVGQEAFWWGAMGVGVGLVGWFVRFSYVLMRGQGGWPKLGPTP
jgi:hypothetical protein